MAKPCGSCGGGSAVPAGGGEAFTIQLGNGVKVGSFPTQAHAEVALKTTYNNNGRVVRR